MPGLILATFFIGAALGMRFNVLILIPALGAVGCCYIGCRQRRRCISMFHYCSAGLCRPADRLSGRRCDAILCRVESTCQSRGRGAEVTLSPADP